MALAQGVDPDGAPSWNVPPTRRLYAVTEVHPLTDEGTRAEDTVRLLDQFRWGLVPHWAKDVRMGNKMINARAETVATTPAYRSAFAAHRCLIVVDGFYEWHLADPAEPKKKVPYYFHRADGRPITFAGLYETWWDKSRSPDPDPETLAAHLHHHHHGRRRRHGRDPQPHARHSGDRPICPTGSIPTGETPGPCTICSCPPRPAPCCATPSPPR